VLTSREKFIHGCWIIGILTAAVIFQSSVKVDVGGDVATVIGVATGMVSLVVGIIAIFYSFVSNNSLSETSSRLKDSSTAIQKSVEDVSSNLKEITERLSPLSDVAKKVAEVHTKIQAASQVVQTTNSTPPQPAHNKFDAVEFVEYFLKVSSWSGLLVLYLAKEAHKKNKPFNIYAWSKATNGISAEYSFGFLVASVATGTLTYNERVYQERGEILIIQFIPLLSDRIDKRIDEDMKRPGITKQDSDSRISQKANTDKYIHSL
jgi:hypothetical protein